MDENRQKDRSPDAKKSDRTEFADEINVDSKNKNNNNNNK